MENFKETKDSIIFYNLNDIKSIEPQHLDNLKLKKNNIVIRQNKNFEIISIDIEDLVLSKKTNEIITNDCLDSLHHITYRLITDNSYKNIGGVLKINTDLFESIKEQKKSLRQFFFLSLGQFSLRDEKKEENSIMTKYYEFSNELSSYDKILLTTHYNYYNKFPLTFEEFNFIQRKIKGSIISNGVFCILKSCFY